MIINSGLVEPSTTPLFCLRAGRLSLSLNSVHAKLEGGYGLHALGFDIPAYYGQEKIGDGEAAIENNCFARAGKKEVAAH